MAKTAHWRKRKLSETGCLCWCKVNTSSTSVRPEHCALTHCDVYIKLNIVWIGAVVAEIWFAEYSKHPCLMSPFSCPQQSITGPTKMWKLQTFTWKCWNRCVQQNVVSIHGGVAIFAQYVMLIFICTEIRYGCHLISNNTSSAGVINKWSSYLSLLFYLHRQWAPETACW